MSATSGEAAGRFHARLAAALSPVTHWVKHELARKYHQPVPKLIPAHWLNDRWSQEWPASSTRQPRSAVREKVRRMDRQNGGAVLDGLGFAALPIVFGRGRIYTRAAGSSRKKNTHAYCFHIDLDKTSGRS
jgi:peptidyl-dipeptidase A